MALVQCHECGAEISSTARACPRCGAARPGRKVWPWVIGAPLAVLVLMLIYGATIPEYQGRALEVRKMCEELAPLQKETCRAQYDESIRKGRESGAR